MEIKERIYYWFLRKSGMWRYWYEKFLTELLYDLERSDDKWERKESMEKYILKLKKFKDNKRF